MKNSELKLKAKKIFDAHKSVEIYMPSGKTANWVCWELIDLFDQADKKITDRGIQGWRRGRHMVKQVNNNEYFQYLYDYDTKRVTFHFLNGNGKTIEQIKREKEIDKVKHQMLPDSIKEQFKAIGTTAETPTEEIMVICKWFNPSGSGTWYLYEMEEDEEIFWCYANLGDPRFAECGTVSFTELAEFEGMFGLHIERDIHFKPMKLKEIMDAVEAGKHI